MSKALLLSCVLTTGYVAFLVVSFSDSPEPVSPDQTSTGMPRMPDSDLESFLQSLNPDAINRCLRLHKTGKTIDQRTLLQCGDFTLYAKHQRLPQQYAAGHFKNILLNSPDLNSLRAQLRESADLVVPVFQTR